MKLTATLILFLFCPHAFAQATQVGPKFSMRPGVDLARLANETDAEVIVQKNGDRYESDASAVLIVDREKLFQVSLQYDHYVDWGMPGVEKSVELPSYSSGYLLIWTRMSTLGQTSEHFLKVQARTDLVPAGSLGLEWHLDHPTPDQSGGFPDKPLFDALDGSWYIEPLANGSVYVRYFLSGQLNTWLPDFIIRSFVTRQFHDGIQKVIKILATQAKTSR